MLVEYQRSTITCPAQQWLGDPFTFLHELVLTTAPLDYRETNSWCMWGPLLAVDPPDGAKARLARGKTVCLKVWHLVPATYRPKGVTFPSPDLQWAFLLYLRDAPSVAP